MSFEQLDLGFGLGILVGERFVSVDVVRRFSETDQCVEDLKGLRRRDFEAVNKN